MKLLVSLGCRVVFALDKDVCIRDDHNIKRLKQFVNVEYIWDKEDLLGDIRTDCALLLILRWRNAPLIWTNFSI